MVLSIHICKMGILPCLQVDRQVYTVNKRLSIQGFNWRECVGLLLTPLSSGATLGPLLLPLLPAQQAEVQPFWIEAKSLQSLPAELSSTKCYCGAQETSLLASSPSSGGWLLSGWHRDCPFLCWGGFRLGLLPTDPIRYRQLPRWADFVFLWLPCGFCGCL